MFASLSVDLAVGSPRLKSSRKSLRGDPSHNLQALDHHLDMAHMAAIRVVDARNVSPWWSRFPDGVTQPACRSTEVLAREPDRDATLDSRIDPLTQIEGEEGRSAASDRPESAETGDCARDRSPGRVHGLIARPWSG